MWSPSPQPSGGGRGAPPLLVTASASEFARASALTGTYLVETTNHNKPVYKKQVADCGLVMSPVRIYFWDDRDGPSFSGWWFGTTVGRPEYYAFNEQKSELPPQFAWKRLMVDVDGQAFGVGPESRTLTVRRLVPESPENAEALQAKVQELRWQLRDKEREDAERKQRLHIHFNALQTEVEELRSQLEAQQKEVALAQVSVMAWPTQYSEYHLQPVAVADPVFKLITDIVVNSCVRHRKDLRSRDLCAAPQFRIHSVEAVVNPRLMKLYFAKAEELEGLRRGEGCGHVAALKHLKLADRTSCASLSVDLNEHLLMHGALDRVLGEICRGGFDPRRGGEGAGKMFGVATYFAVNASKADIYTEDPTQRLAKQALRKMIVAKALLGVSHRATAPMRDAHRPPDGSDGRPMDSVWADVRDNGGAVDHHEVMIYDKGQVYPQFVVTYAHVDGCSCAECLKRPPA